MTVAAPPVGIGGSSSVIPRAVRIWAARAVPRVTDRFTWFSPKFKSTTRTERSAWIASVAERSCPVAFSFFSIARWSRKARLATKMCALTRSSVWW